MSENERLCNKLEHLEEIFVHQARPGGFKNDSSSSSSSSSSPKGGSGGAEKLARHLKAENSSLRVRLQKFEKEQKGSGSSSGGCSGSSESSKFVNSNVGERKEKQDVLELKGQNVQLQRRLEKYRKREMELLRALKAQQLRRSGAANLVKEK
jgi:hypothetical protein